jgi:hypothetical protein
MIPAVSVLPAPSEQEGREPPPELKVQLGEEPPPRKRMALIVLATVIGTVNVFPAAVSLSRKLVPFGITSI